MIELSAEEARVLGALMEKEVTTPDVYPLSLNALVAACNQKTSREPLMTMTERDCEAALRSLEANAFLRVDHGSRVERYENRARTVLHLRRDEAAILCVLLLRGPQTPGELRGRAERLFAFEDVAQVVSALTRMTAVSEERSEALVQMLPRQPGAREPRYAQRLTGTVEQAEPGAFVRNEVSPALSPTLDPRIVMLEKQVNALLDRVARLEQQAGIAAFFTPDDIEQDAR